MALRLPLCVFNRHSPRRSKVRWDGLNYVGRCRYCGQTIRKIDDKVWRKELAPAEADD